MQMNSKLIRWSLLVWAVLWVAPAVAQQPAPRASVRIVGRVLDSSTGSGLSAVTVQVVGTNLGAISGLDGRYMINNVPVGRVTLRATSIGYTIKNVSDIEVDVGIVVEQNISMETEAVAIGAIEVTAAAERGSVNRALDQQRTATGIVNAITAEQMSRSPDSDAAAAVQRVSGVTVQDNKFVVVRGLGERYTTTSLNGSRIPSPEPEKKMVPLDLFPTSLLEQITTIKTFTPEQPGDFSGAQVDIKTREFPTTRQGAFSVTFGANDAVTGKTLPGPVRHGLEWLAFGSHERSVSERLREAGNFSQQFSQEEINTLIRSMNNNWSARSTNGTPLTAVGASLGGNEAVFGQQLGYLLSGTYSLSQEVRADEVRALAFPADNGTTDEIDRFTGSTARNNVLWGGLANFSTLIGSTTRIALNTTYNRSADNEARHEIGLSDDDGFPLQISRLRYVERSVASGQLMGEHEFASNHRFDWSLSGSHVTRDEPDRSEFVYEMQPDPLTGTPQEPAWLAAANEGAVRTFAELSESAAEAKLNHRVSFGATRSHNVKLGGLVRMTNREADNRAYSITAPTLSRSARQRAAEEIIVEHAQPGSTTMRLQPLLQGGSYTAEDMLSAGYAQIEYGLSQTLRLITGARVEHSEVEVVTEPSLGDRVTTKPSYTDLLPALTLNWTLSDAQNVRLSASQTLSRPEYREMAPVAYRDVIGGENITGNASLKRSLIRNVDLRWELYPGAGEIISVALFGKFFQDPIERVYLGTSGTRVVTFVNAEGATNYGVELELRKNLGVFVDALQPLTFSSNLTVMHSDIRIRGGGSFEDQRAMVGQAPYVVNTALTYISESGALSATALYNVVGKRVHSASEAPLPDVYEQPRYALDFAFRFPFVGGLAAKLDVKNVLDSPYEITQGTATREYYKSGRVLSFGLNWKR
jgi:outer membrane receptor protein involved in Fe transport